MDNLNDIISSLSGEDIEMLRGVASSILGTPPAEEAPQSEMASQGLNLSSADIDMMLKAKSILEKMNNASSKNADLITALKPHLSDDSQKKADTAIRMLRLFEILPYIKDLF